MHSTTHHTRVVVEEVQGYAILLKGNSTYQHDEGMLC